jgi:hypothetical protein
VGVVNDRLRLVRGGAAASPVPALSTGSGVVPGLVCAGVRGAARVESYPIDSALEADERVRNGAIRGCVVIVPDG